MSSIYNLSDKNHLEKNIMFDPDGGVGIQRFDQLRYPWIDDHNQYSIGLFWRPEDTNLTKDGNDFRTAGDEVQHIFTSNLLRQIMLDTLQSRAPTSVFQAIVSEPATESYLATWSFFEAIHSRSYTHIIRGIYSNPAEIFDQVNKIPEIVGAAKSIAKYYDRLGMWNDLRNLAQGLTDTAALLGEGADRLENSYEISKAMSHASGVYDEYEHKKAAWRAWAASNALEAIRFVVSFSCAFAMDKNRLMEGNATIMSQIFRDERQHYSFTAFIMMRAIEEDPDFARIAVELYDEVLGIYRTVNEEEKVWARYLFKNGQIAIIGLTLPMLEDEIDWLTARTTAEVQIEWDGHTPASRPLIWMNEKEKNGNRQKALQETDNDAYIIGAIDNTDDNMAEYVQANSRMALPAPDEQPVEPKQLVVYSKPGCPQCDMLKRVLTQRGIEFRAMMLDVDYSLPDLLARHEGAGAAAPRTFPVVWFGDTYVGGLVETNRWLSRP